VQGVQPASDWGGGVRKRHLWGVTWGEGLAKLACAISEAAERGDKISSSLNLLASKGGNVPKRKTLTIS